MRPKIGISPCRDTLAIRRAATVAKRALKGGSVAAKDEKPKVRMLLLVGDRIGANCMMGGKKLSILEKFGRFGWEVTLAGVADTVEPCAFAAKRG